VRQRLVHDVGAERAFSFQRRVVVEAQANAYRVTIA
jgi:hypothetical protein